MILKGRKHSFWLLCATIWMLVVAITSVYSETPQMSAQEARLQADNSVRGGKFQEAIRFYTIAISSDPNDASLYYKRAVSQLNFGRQIAALSDLDRVTELNPAYWAVYPLRGRINLALGHLDEAQSDLEHVSDSRHQYSEGTSKTMREQLASIAVVRSAASEGDRLLKMKKWDEAEEKLSKVLDMCPHAWTYRQKRADLRFGKGDYAGSYADASVSTRLNPSDLRGYMLMAKAAYKDNDRPKALEALRVGLKMDPENPPLSKFHKQLRRIDRLTAAISKAMEASRWSDAITKLETLVTVDDTHVQLNGKAYEDLCLCHYRLGKYEKGLELCQKAVNIDESLSAPILTMARIYIAKEDFDLAIGHLNRLRSQDPQNHEVMQLLQEAEQKRRIANRKDLYKLLGVTKDSSSRDIKRAYRRLMVKLHPDKNPDDPKALDKFREMTEAYEILGNEEKRKQYDEGAEIEDIQKGEGAGGGGGGGFPGGFPGGPGGGFHQFFQQGGGGGPGGGFTFRFG